MRSSHRILVVDDHETLRRGVQGLLSGVGWTVCGEAANGKEAIEKARTLKPDLVILDISMPVLNGMEAIPEILKNAPSAKILMFSMHDSEHLRKQVAQLGAHGFVTKAAPSGDLLAAVARLLGES